MALPQLSQDDQLRVLLHQAFAKPHTELFLQSLERLLPGPEALREALQAPPWLPDRALWLAASLAVSPGSSADQWPASTFKIKLSRPLASTMTSSVPQTSQLTLSRRLSVD